MEEVKSVEDLVKKLRENDVVVVDFYAEWCGPCKLMQPIVEEVANEVNHIKFVKADVDKAKDLANIFRIQAVPMLAILKKNNEDVNIDFLIGLRGKDEVKSWINNHLKEASKV